MNRYLRQQILKDLQEKMVFLGGPRQVGKTTLAKTFLTHESQYLNWDFQSDKKIILESRLNAQMGLIILDEVHKFAKWRSLLKGYYDKYYPHLNFIVTGSAQLDHFRKGGDSLVGRYHYLRLHPLSLAEINTSSNLQDVNLLLKFGGFPEPFFKQDETFHRRWQIERISRVINQDLRDLETVKEISLLELLAHTLESRVGSPFSVVSLREDLEVSINTISRWIEILERLYVCFRISPYGLPQMKAVKKTQKIYMWDWSQVESLGARFENLVASQLLKFCHHQEDTLGLKTELRYFKDIATGKEIDFIILQNKKPLFAVECKTGDKQISPALINFGQKLKIPKLYQVHLGKKDYGIESSGRVLPFYTFCKETNMP